MGFLQPWHDFFILTGTSAATLLGLVFVAASIAATVPNEKLGDERSRKLWVLPIVYAFLRVLVVCAIGVIPGQSARSFGVALAVLAGLDFGRTGWLLRGTQEQHRSRERFTFRDWGWYVIYPVGATLVIAGAGLAIACGYPFPLAVVAGGLIAHLVIGVHNAWELADWLATRQ